MNIVNGKTCGKCGKYKTAEHFSKSRNKRDGLQQDCKECNKLTNSKYREEHPNYWSYEDGYFSDKEKWQYIRMYNKADKTIKIYTIKFSDDLWYVGSTKTLLNTRLTRHIVDYRRVQQGFHNRSIPLLHAEFEKRFGTDYDKLAEFLKENTYIIEECTGSRTKQMRLEAIWIIRIGKQGKTLLNKQLPKRFEDLKIKI